MISGIVTDGQGHPRAGLVVSSHIPHDRNWWTRTDPQGRFELQSLNGIGRDPLDVHLDDYNIVFRNVAIGTKDLKYVKQEPGQISGVLLDQDGKRPLADPSRAPFGLRIRIADLCTSCFAKPAWAFLPTSG